MLPVDVLLSLWLDRERDAGPQKARDRETLEFFEGRISVPLPEIDRNERSAVANLLSQGMTAQGQRIGSTVPVPKFFVEREGEAARARARNKKRALVGMWDENRLHLQRRQRARWLIAYATSPVVVRPRFVNGQWSIKWELRSALSAYPSPTPAHLDMEPYDTVFARDQSAAKLESAYPQHQAALRALRGYRPDNPVDTRVTVIEYFGPDEYVCAAVGACDPSNPAVYASTPTRQGKWCVELERVENRVGRSMAIIPNSIALETPLPRYEGMKGLYQMQAKLMALEYRYVANSVDPPTYFVESESGGDFVPADGPAGIPGRIPAGGALQVVNPPAGVGTNNMIDRLERAQRLEGGVAPDLGGESGTNIRTGRRGQDILSAVMDFPIQEAQEILAESQHLEDRLAIDEALAWFPDMKRSWGGFEFVPSKTFTGNDWHEVSYALAGADADGQVIRVGQLVGMGLMSEDTGRELIPEIKDAEAEKDRVVAGQIRKGILADFMQPSAPGDPMNVVVKARVAQLVEDNAEELPAAILRAQREWQENQSPDINPVSPTAPEAMPGIVPPGAGTEAGTAAPEGSDLSGLTSLLAGLRTPQAFATPQERTAEAQAAF